MDNPVHGAEKSSPSVRLPEEIVKKLADQEFEIYSFREMMNRLQEGIYITDNRGITLYVNSAFVHLSGLSREDLIGKRVNDMRDDGILPNSCCAKVIETRRPVMTINNYYHGQKCLVSGSPVFDPEGNLIRTIAVVRDVSELDAMVESLTRSDGGWMPEKPHYLDDEGPLQRASSADTPALLQSEEPLMQDIYIKASRMADLDSTMLIVGETGTGKDYLAAAIHEIRKKSKSGELIRINCGAIPEHLIESELFGYEKGAFTGAAPEGRKGLLEAAGEGTILLDEIGEMPYVLQVKLLNVLNDRQFYRVGGHRMIDFKARVIATTNANLGEQVKLKKFRADLFYRLNVFRISMPPLRLRQADILPLLNRFLNDFNRAYRKSHSFSSESLLMLKDYRWPGNIREMKNFVEKAVVFTTGEPMRPDDVTAVLTSDIDLSALDENRETDIKRPFGTGGIVEKQNLKEAMDAYEERLLKRTIADSKTLRDAADSLGIDFSTLMRKKRKYGLSRQ